MTKNNLISWHKYNIITSWQDWIKIPVGVTCNVGRGGAPEATSDDAIEYDVGCDVFIQEDDGSLSAVNQVWQDLSTIC